MEIDIDALEAAAQKATPGPWIYSPMTEREDPEIGASNGSRVAALVAADITKANSAYIASANPAVVLELVRRLREADEARIIGEYLKWIEDGNANNMHQIIAASIIHAAPIWEKSRQEFLAAAAGGAQ
jgi:hypothetical protein